MLPQLQLAEKIVARAVAVLHGRSHPCCGAEAVSHDHADHGNSPVARG